ncbi:MAG: hypothetical protein ACPHN2_19865 [Sinimarinibacterium flocculans]|uniref:hypothetical protein n=1 Tax=Sinimarinibacterium flocculans TaxID=985250 RepID=UPI003C53AD8B
MKRENLLGLICSASVLLAACGGGGGGGGGDPTPTPTPTATPPPTEPDFVSCAGNTCTISGDVDEDYTMVASRNWILDDVVRVGAGNVSATTQAAVDAIKAAGVTLTIEPGTNIKATDDASLLVTRGSKINANGTAAAPITFSSLDDGFDGEGEWGGVVIQGFAPQFGQGNSGACSEATGFCNVQGEGGDFIGVYGGTDAADDSGVFRYVRIAEGGLIAGPNNEVNGLTLQGVGHGTTIEYVQVHANLDDGVEWFGGTVNARYLVLTSNDDDDLDYDEGYQGNVQYVIVRKNPTKLGPTGSNDPRMIEANSSDADYTPQTNAVLANITAIGSQVSKGEPGFRLRGAVQSTIYNTALVDVTQQCVRIDNADTDGDGTTDVDSVIGLVNVIGDCDAGFYRGSNVANPETNVQDTTVTLDDAYAVTQAAAQLGAPANIVPVANGSSFTFDQTDYIGAVEPGTAANEAWWAGWTLPGTLTEADEEEPAAADFVSCTATVCTMTGDVTEDYVMVASRQWIIDDVVRVGAGNVSATTQAQVDAIKAAGVTLTIRPGVDIRATNDASLLVTRGSKLIAAGTAAAPITFSSLDDGFDGEGEWGGVVIQGFAPQFGQGNTGACSLATGFCNVQGEGGDFIGVYGGDDPADNSGIIRYVRIAEGGLIAGPNNEVNGLTLQGVGHGTQLEFVQVHANLDDGVEWFGGTVNARYLVLTSNDDDDLDYDEGYQGNVQYVIIRKNPTKADPSGSNDPRMIEANSSDADYTPQTNAALANITAIGAEVSDGEPGFRLRGAVTTTIYNTALANVAQQCVRIDNADTDGDGTADVNSVIGMVNVIGDCDAGFYRNNIVADPDTNTATGTVTIDAAYAVTEAAAQLGAAPQMSPVNNGSSFTFDPTDYIGAVEPGTAAGQAWWAGWTLPGTL